jgi:hypothetical protein
MHHTKRNAIEFGLKRSSSDCIGINANYSVDYIDIQVFVLIQPHDDLTGDRCHFSFGRINGFAGYTLGNMFDILTLAKEIRVSADCPDNMMGA